MRLIYPAVCFQLSPIPLSFSLQPFFCRRVEPMFGPMKIGRRQLQAIPWPLWLPIRLSLFPRSFSCRPFGLLLSQTKIRSRLQTMRCSLWPTMRRRGADVSGHSVRASLGRGTASVGRIIAPVRVSGWLLLSVPVPCAATGSSLRIHRQRNPTLRRRPRLILFYPPPFGRWPHEQRLTVAGAGCSLLPGRPGLVLSRERPVCARCV